MRRVILVNGVPASGKTTVSRRLIEALGAAGIGAVPLSLDTVKEALFVHLGTGDRDHNRRLGRASYHAIFDIVARLPGDLVPVIDAWHGFVPEEAVRAHLARAGDPQVIEVWCRVSPETAAARYRARSGDRHPGHPPASYADELLALAGRARPLALGRVVEIDTEAGPDTPALASVLRLLGDAETGRVAD